MRKYVNNTSISLPQKPYSHLIPQIIEHHPEDCSGEVSDETDIPGESYGDIDCEKYSRRAVLWIPLGLEFEEYIRKYCHRESADSDGIPTSEKEKRNSYKYSIQEEKEHESVSSEDTFDLIPEEIEEEAIREKMKNASMKELIQEKLDTKLEIESLSEEERIHPIHQNTTHKERYSRGYEGEENESIREAFILHVS